MRFPRIGPALHLTTASVKVLDVQRVRPSRDSLRDAADALRESRRASSAPSANRVHGFGLAGRDHRRGDRRRRSSASARPKPRLGRASGRIEGTVEISSALTARRPQFRIYADPGTGVDPGRRRHEIPIAEEARNVVIYLEGDSTRLAGSASATRRRRHGVIAQRDERFVAARARRGRRARRSIFRIRTTSSTTSSRCRARPAPAASTSAAIPRAPSRSWTFPKPGTVQVFCHIHSDMSAIVLVLPNPFFASPDESHRFVIDDVPEGDYTIVGWHERIKPITRRIHVSAGQTTVVDFNIPLPQGGARP